MQLSKNRTKVLILTHYYFREEGGGDTDERVLNYLKNKVKQIILIASPFFESESKTTFCFVYKNGKLSDRIEIKNKAGSQLLQLIHQTLIVYKLLFKYGLSYDLCLCLENFSFITIYPLRAITLIKKVIYYSIDLVPNRFSNKVYDFLYHFLYKVSCQFSDTNWVLTKEQIKGSVKFGVTSKNSSPFSIVPIGYETENINILPTEKINFYNIVYAGSFRESMGPELTVRILPSLVKLFPKIKLTLIGAGKEAGKLKKLIKELNIKKYVDFLGYIEEFNDLTKILSQKSIGLAPYKPIPGSFSFYSDPSKIKLYMVCGLPVITTNVATMANLIKKTGSGLVVNYSEKALTSAIKKLLTNAKLYSKYKNSAIKLSKKFDVNNILKVAVRNIPN